MGHATLFLAASVGAAIVATPFASAQDAPQSARPDERDMRQEVVIVTANRREESVQDVAQSISALSGNALLEQGIGDYESLVRSVPGIVATGETSFAKLTVRGVETSRTTSGNGAQKPVSIYLDDLPLTTFSVLTPDITPFDFSHVEVLRGPQGTLFGPGSLAGAVRYITNKPDLSGFDAAINLDGGISENESYRRRIAGMINVPFTDNLAVRVAANYKNDDGFVDNVGTGTKNANSQESIGIRAGLRWVPTDNFAATLTGSFNTTTIDDTALYDPGIGVRKASSQNPFGISSDLKTLNLQLEVDLGWADLTSSSTAAEAPDVWTLELGAIIPGVPYNIQSDTNTKTIVQEVRLVSKPSEVFDWVAGLYYLNQNSDTSTVLFFATPFIDALNITGLPTNLAPGSANSYQPQKNESQEVAAFGEATYHLSDTLKLAVGVRVTDSIYSTSLTGGFSAPDSFPAIFTGGNQNVPLVPNAVGTFPTGHKVTATPRVSLTWQPDSEHTYYAMAAQGFRRDHPNGVVSLNGGRSLVDPADPSIIPESANGDSLWNYEIGAKAFWLGGLLRTNVSAYYIDWSNMQVSLVRPSDQFPYIGNIGKARSVGLEGELEIWPTDDFNFGLNFTLQEAKVTSITSEQALISGAEISSKLSSPTTSFSAFGKYTWEWGGADMHARLDAQYVGAYPNAFPNTPGAGTVSPTFASVPPYNKVDLSIGWSQDNLGLVLYADNLLDNDDPIFINPANFSFNRYATLRPRTIGVRLNWKY